MRVKLPDFFIGAFEGIQNAEDTPFVHFKSHINEISQAEDDFVAYRENVSVSGNVQMMLLPSFLRMKHRNLLELDCAVTFFFPVFRKTFFHASKNLRRLQILDSFLEKIKLRSYFKDCDVISLESLLQPAQSMN